MSIDSTRRMLDDEHYHRSLSGMEYNSKAKQDGELTV
jgi:hypothetical protein